MACLGDSPRAVASKGDLVRQLFGLELSLFHHPQLMRQGRKLRRSHLGKQVFWSKGTQSLSVPRLLARASLVALSNCCTGDEI